MGLVHGYGCFEVSLRMHHIGHTTVILNQAHFLPDDFAIHRDGVGACSLRSRNRYRLILLIHHLFVKWVRADERGGGFVVKSFLSVSLVRALRNALLLFGLFSIISFLLNLFQLHAVVRLLEHWFEVAHRIRHHLLLLPQS